MINIPNIICYAENGVHQCWSCANRCGITVVDTNIHGISVILPQCAISDQYMVAVNKIPCSSYKPRVSGKWIVNEDPKKDTCHGKCPVCNWEAHYYEDDVCGMPYCPNCGSRLE